MMSMAPYLPPTSGEAGAVYALLQVIADPKAAKAALDKMMKAREEIDAATEKQSEQFAKAQEVNRREIAHYEKVKAEADRVATQAQADLATAKSKLAEAERRKSEAQGLVDFAGKERDALEGHKLEVKEKMAQQLDMARVLEMRERDLERSEAKLKQREDDLALREKTLAEDIAEHNRWLASLRPPKTR